MTTETATTTKVSVDGDELRRALKRVRHAASDDYTRPILATILFEPKDKMLRLVAADNFRLAYMPVAVTGDIEALGKFCIDLTDADALRAFIKGSGRQASVSIERAGAGITFGIGVRSATYRTVDGKWPDYLKVIEAAEAAQDRRSVSLNPWLLSGLRRSGSLTLRMSVAGPEDVVTFVDLADEFHEYIMPVRTHTSGSVS